MRYLLLMIAIGIPAVVLAKPDPLKNAARMTGILVLDDCDEQAWIASFE